MSAKRLSSLGLSFLAATSLAACATVSEPDGFGDLEGLDNDALAAPPSPWNELPLAPGVFREGGKEYRSDVIDIPLEPGGELEYKLGMSEGDSIVYEWNAVDMLNPELLYAEFHGHTERIGDAQGDLMFYRKASGGSESGALTAPFTGIHGWYLKNDTDEDIVVRLNVAGFYELIAQ